VSHYLKIYRIILETFGFQVRPIGTFFLSQLRHGIDMTTRGLDHLFYPGFRRVPIDRPIFILGNPRSGTTFLHRFLLETGRLSAFEMWEMLFPAVTAHKLLGGLVDKLGSVSPAKYHGSDAHQTSLKDVETDDVAAFIKYMDEGFAWCYFFAWDDQWGSEQSRKIFYENEEAAERREQVYAFMESCWRRNMYLKGKERFVAKSSLYTLRTDSLLQRYPDCKLIYLVRDPLETIPSGLSLVTNVLESAYNMFESTDPQRLQKYLNNLYRASCYMYERFDQVQREGRIPQKNLKVITYPNLLKNLESTITDLLEFLEIEPDPSFFDTLKAEDEKQRNYKSEHKYSLDKYGLTEEQIRRDLSFVYEIYDLAI